VRKQAHWVDAIVQKGLEFAGARRDFFRSPFGRILKWPTRADCKSAG
jgi:hypothetical protein